MLSTIASQVGTVSILSAKQYASSVTGATSGALCLNLITIVDANLSPSRLRRFYPYLLEQLSTYFMTTWIS